MILLAIASSVFFQKHYSHPHIDEVAKRGADKENSLCCNMLAQFYRYGVGCSKDLAKTKEYERKAKELKSQSKVSAKSPSVGGML